MSEHKAMQVKRLLNDLPDSDEDKINKIKSLLRKKGGGNMVFVSEIWEIAPLSPENISFEENKILIAGGKGNKDRVTILPKHWKPEYMKYIPMACTKRAMQTELQSSN